MKFALWIIMILPLILLLSCTSQTEKIEKDIKPFMEQYFPESDYSVENLNHNIHLNITSPKNFSDEYVEAKLTMALERLYRSFYYRSSIAATDTKISVTLITEASKWNSKKYSLFELGEMFKLK